MSIHVNPNSQTREWLAVLAVLLLGAWLRLYGLPEKIIWHDEVATRVLAGGGTMAAQMQALYSGQVLSAAQVLKFQQVQSGVSVLDTITDLALHDPQHPPLYYVLAKAWVLAWGDSAYTLRVLSVCCGVLGLLALYWLMRELSSDRRTALLATLLASVSPMLILYAQEAREYALWYLLLMLSSASLLRALRRSPDTDSSEQNNCAAAISSRTKSLLKAWLPYAVCTLLAVYTSFTTLSLLLVQLLYVAWRTRLQWSPALVGFSLSLATVGVLFLPWALNLLRNFEAFSVSMAWSSVIVIPRAAVLRILSLNFTRNFYDFWPDVMHEQWMPIMASMVCVALIVGALVWVVRRMACNTGGYVLLLVLWPTAMLLVPDLLWGGIRSSNARYLMPAWIGVVAAVALALGAGLRCVGLRRTFARLLVALLLLLALATDLWHAREAAPWTKSLSISLPEVARIVNRAQTPLIVGNQERHHPGNLFALANLLKPDTRIQFVPIAMEATWRMPKHEGAVFLYSPTDQFRAALEKNNLVTTRLLIEDLFLQLWLVEPASGR